jgi:hypothetical protein
MSIAAMAHLLQRGRPDAAPRLPARPRPLPTPRPSPTVRDTHPMVLDVKLLLVGCAGARQWIRRRGCAFEAAVQDADQTVAELTQGRVVAVPSANEDAHSSRQLTCGYRHGCGLLGPCTDYPGLAMRGSGLSPVGRWFRRIDDEGGGRRYGRGPGCCVLCVVDLVGTQHEHIEEVRWLN